MGACGDPAAHPLARYYLPDYVHVCQTDEGIVFLDARRDRYFGLGGECVAPLGQVVSNWPIRSTTCSDTGSLDDVREMAQVLLQRDLLATGTPPQSAQTRVSAPPLEMLRPGAPDTRRRPARPFDVASILAAFSKAAWSIKWRSLESIASGLNRRRRAHQMNAAADIEEALELADLFRRMRAVFLSEKDRCLINALSLTYFLRRRGHDALWVIGVKTAPFAAHSWVQSGPVLLDGDPAVVCHFVPILAA